MPDYPTIQAALIGLIKGAQTEVGERVYDQVPRESEGVPAPTMPYVAIGDGQQLADDTSCQTGIDEYVDIHIWSAGPGKPETRRIADAIRDALHTKTMPVAGTSSCTAWVRGVRIFEDDDEVSWHGVVTVRILHQRG